jgi:hypothetical protein
MNPDYVSNVVAPVANTGDGGQGKGSTGTAGASGYALLTWWQ